MSENDRPATVRPGNRKKPKLSHHKSSVPQNLIFRASLLAGAVGVPQISGIQTPGSLPGAAGPSKSSAAGDQPEDHDATTVEPYRVADRGRLSSRTIDNSSNPGHKTESPWEISFRGLDPNQREALSRYNFQNQHPTELFEMEIGHIRDLRDRCIGGLATGEDNKTFMTRGRVHSILKKVEKYAKIGDIAIQHHPEIVALIWAGLRMSLQVALNDLATFDRLSSVLDDIATAMYACKVYENLYSSSKFASARAVMDRLSPMYAACLKVIAEAILYSEEKTSTRVGKGITNPFETRFQPLIDDIDGERKKLEAYTHAVSHESLAKLSKALDEDERVKALKWISRLKYGDHHDDVKESRFAGTGEWLFQNCTFTSWIKCEHSSLLWLHGKAGSGKTVLSSIVVDALTATYKSTPTIYFYCNFNEQPRKQAYSIIRSLLKQLSVATETLDPEILAAFRSAKEKGNPTTSLSRGDAERFLRGAMSQAGEAFVVLDALDECEEEERKVLISFLCRQLALDSCQVKIFLTSRPEDGLHRLFKDSRFKNLLAYKIDVGDTVQDIGLFVTQRVDELIESKAFLYGRNVTHDFRQHLITTLTGGADGVFLWARYQLEAICELGSESEIRTQLTQLPKGLEEAYIRIWSKIRGFPNAKSSRAYRTLMWLLSSTRPLKSEEIIMATVIKPLDTVLQEQEQVSLEYLVSACGNLVYLDGKAGVLRFMHFSVQEFLVQQPELKDAEGFVADVCFTALGFPQRPTPIWDYVAHNWERHARCWREINGDRSTLIGRFLLAAPRLEEWLTHSKWPIPLWDTDRPLKPPSRYGAIGVCVSLKLPIILDYLLRRNTEHSEGDLSELVSAALLLAAAIGCFDMADLLLKAGANTRWRMLNWVALQLGWPSGYGIGVKLEETGAGLAGVGSATALQVAAGGGHEEVVKLLLKSNADVNDCGRFRVSLNLWGGNVTCETALQAACVNGSGEVVRLLLNAGAAADAPGRESGTLLQAAAAGGHGRVVELLLKAGADASVQKSFHFYAAGHQTSCGTALQAACLKGDEKAVELLINAGADVGALGGECGTPLQAAVAGGPGHERVVELLLNAGANANFKHSFRLMETPWDSSDIPRAGVLCETALQVACMKGDDEAVELLINAGADVGALGGECGTPLQAAVAGGPGHERVVELLLNAGANANFKHSFRLMETPWDSSDIPRAGVLCETALQVACMKGGEEVVELLINAGAAADVLGGECGTPLQAAAAGGHGGVIELLLKAGANANVKHSFRLMSGPSYNIPKAGVLCETALQAACVRGDEKAVGLLIDAGAVVDALGGECGAPLQAAAASSHGGAVELLLKAGANANVKHLFRLVVGPWDIPDAPEASVLCETALQAASARGDEKAVELLINAGAIVDALGGECGTPLQAAVAGGPGHERVVEMLLKAGANANIKHAFRLMAGLGPGDLLLIPEAGVLCETALQAACLKRDEKAVELLIDAGAVVEAPGGECGTPLQAAVTGGHGGVIELLLKAGANPNVKHSFRLMAGPLGFCNIPKAGVLCETALQVACVKGREEAVELLINAGAAVDAGGECGTPLQAAVAASRAGVQDLLLKAGANPNVKHVFRLMPGLQDILHIAEAGVLCETALQAACLKRDEKAVELLIDAGAVVEALGGGEYGTPLQAAAAGGHGGVVELLLKAGADAKVEHSFRLMAGPLDTWHIPEAGVLCETALQVACMKGREEAVELLINAGAAVDARGDCGTPLQAAAAGGHGGVVELLLKAGANANIKHSFRLTVGPLDVFDISEASVLCETALQVSCVKGDEKVVELLINAGAVADARGGECGTPLQAAAAGGHGGVVELLLKAGADANIQNSFYVFDAAGCKVSCRTALQAACVRGDEKAVELLINAGAVVDALGGRCGTPLQAAVVGSHGGVVELLLKAGADANIQNSFYFDTLGCKASCRTALQAACVRGDEKAVELLINAGAVVDALGGKFGTPLQAAAAGGHEGVAKLLLKAGANVNVKHLSRLSVIVLRLGIEYTTEIGVLCETALQAACVRGDERVVALLVNAGAAVDVLGDGRRTPLQAAAAGSHRGVLELLLKAGADANVQNSFHFYAVGHKASCRTALQAASVNGNKDIVGLLVNAGAAVDALGGECGTPLQAAAAGGHGEVVELLLKANADVNLRNSFRPHGAKTEVFFQTALQAASSNGSEAIVQQLLDAGANSQSPQRARPAYRRSIMPIGRVGRPMRSMRPRGQPIGLRHCDYSENRFPDREYGSESTGSRGSRNIP